MGSGTPKSLSFSLNQEDRIDSRTGSIYWTPAEPVVGSVVGSDLIDSGTETADLSVRGRRGHTAVTAAPGDSISEHPCVPLWQTSRPPESPWRKERGEVCMGSGGTTGKCREQDRGPALTWCKEAPAQIMELVMHEPQYCWHHLTVTRGRSSHRRCV